VDPLLSIDDLHTSFFLDEGTVRAVAGASLTIGRRTTLGLVGESGCGKSVTALSILRLIEPPGRIVSGRIVLHRNGQAIDLTVLKSEGRAIRRVRGKEIAMVFQEPMTSLSPVHTVGSQIMEAVRLHARMKKGDAKAHTIAVMERVGIPNAARRFTQYAHEMSGGLRQRAMIAMALSCRPSLLIADEPTTALDVTIQAQILELMREIQRDMGMSVLLITHDLGVIAEMATEVAVMYLGRVVESAECRPIFREPCHPYTRALMDSIPGRGARPGSRLTVIAGSVPDPFQVIPGCPFHPRCPEAEAGLCDAGDPPRLVEVRPGHRVACRVRQRDIQHD